MKINKILLCGHTGSKNRGCEAIIRSTVHILKKIWTNDVRALTHDEAYDKKVGLDQDVELIMHAAKRNLFQKGFSFIGRKVFGYRLTSAKQYYRPILKNVGKDTCTFNVGGDTYCYDTPVLSYALNVLTDKYAIKNVFWGCSVDSRCLQDQQMQEDLNRYAVIVTRETLSYALLQSVVEDKNKVILACDPAFHLPMKEVPLPKGYQRKNTLGINLSDLVFRNSHDPDDILYRNVRCLVDEVLEKTDLAVCLIPHVYSAQDRTVDLKVLDMVKSFYPDEPRVMVVDQELSCTELKYIISQCRYFIGARTHATIAAYSTGVPAIALSYSIKSRGIAKDLFGTEEGYVIPWKQIESPKALLDAFMEVLVCRESEMIEQYERILPAYKERILDATREIIRRLS